MLRLGYKASAEQCGPAQLLECVVLAEQRGFDSVFADEIAAAASLLMRQAAEGRPVVRVRGLAASAAASDSRALLRAPSQDLFR